MVIACPAIEVVDSWPETGSNKFRSTLAIALFPRLKANPPDAGTCTLSDSDAPVHGTPGKLLKKDPKPSASLWPLSWVTLTSPYATFRLGSHLNTSRTEAEAPSGPSPYTQIISRSKLEDADAAEAEPPQRAGSGAGMFAAPAMPVAAMPSLATPRMPAAASPVMPRLPPLPMVAPPPMPMPRMTAPAAPKAPKSAAPAPPPVSMWPLILTLTVLFFLAVILVLFFVFRH